jgi:transcriptional regulator with XRE-family HTH domain
MKQIELKNLGKVLRNSRAERGLREIAKEVGVSFSTLSRIENGKEPDIRTLYKVCKWLEIDLGEIVIK